MEQKRPQPAWFLCLPFRASIWVGPDCRHSLGARYPGREPGPGKGSSTSGAELRPSEGDRAQCKVSPVPGAGEENKPWAKNTAPPVPYQRARGKGWRTEETSGPSARAPARAPFKLRFCTSRSAPRRLEPARAAWPIAAALLPDAGQWQRAFLGRARDSPHLLPPSLCVG